MEEILMFYVLISWFRHHYVLPYILFITEPQKHTHGKLSEILKDYNPIFSQEKAIYQITGQKGSS
jgi:hypothetical protein